MCTLYCLEPEMKLGLRSDLKSAPRGQCARARTPQRARGAGPPPEPSLAGARAA